MSIKELEPDGFDEAARAYASMTKPADVYVQGMALRHVAVWLRIDGVHTMIGFGEPDEALREAEAWCAHQIDKARAQINERKSIQPPKGGD
ncbi:MAG TPA: hypothetical protein PLF10_07425 [Dokdonella sp.]|nr:hypothetical protein [Dokdonella sp.]